MHRLFLATFTGTVLLLGSVIAGVGYWVDPFGFFSPPDPNFRRDSAYTLNRSLFRTVEFRKLADEMAAQNQADQRDHRRQHRQPDRFGARRRGHG